jgi:hypothetical protein
MKLFGDATASAEWKAHAKNCENCVAPQLHHIMMHVMLHDATVLAKYGI